MTAKKIILGNERGQILIFITLAFIVLGLLAGLAVDAGRAYLIQARLSTIVDAAAIAGARAMPGGTSLSQAIADATAAACDSAEINGIAATECGTSGPKIFVSVGNVTNPDGSTQQGVIVNAVDAMATSFMQLGTLIGCGAACSNVSVSAAGSAAPDTLMDIALVIDDTGSMDQGCNSSQTDSDCPVKQARDGAEALVDCILGSACGLTSSNAKISLVPFRGCYSSQNSAIDCVRNTSPNNEVVDLTDNSGVIDGVRGTSNGTTDTGTGIKGLWAQGGSGTNVCRGLQEGGSTVFGAGARAIASKVMIVLTDAENNPDEPDTCVASGSNLDIKTYNKATAIKAQDVEIFVIGYSITGIPSASVCNPSPSALTNDRNLAKCIASSTPGTNDHYFEASTPAEINTQFLTIAQELLKKLRLVN